VFILPVQHIPGACKTAQAKGLHTYIVTDMLMDIMEADGREYWRVVVGEHYDTVTSLGRVLSREAAPEVSKPRKSLGAVVVGAAIVGAVVTFTGLAVM
jgi:hypothetical protein